MDSGHKIMMRIRGEVETILVVKKRPVKVPITGGQAREQ